MVRWISKLLELKRDHPLIQMDTQNLKVLSFKRLLKKAIKQGKKARQQYYHR